METTAQILYANAVRLLESERRSYARVDQVYRVLTGGRSRVNASVEEWLFNPFVKTAISILEKFTSNYRIREALKLLQAAGDEAQKAARPGRRARG